jgi:hypothetical protein
MKVYPLFDFNKLFIFCFNLSQNLYHMIILENYDQLFKYFHLINNFPQIQFI